MHFLPVEAGADFVEQKSGALIVRGIQPEHAGENAGGFIESAKTPETQTISVQATQKWPVIGITLGQQTVETGAEGYLADCQPDRVVADGVLRKVVELQIAEVRVGIEAAQVGFAHIHQQLP